jgi:outer membrane lipopolysaccharide assembly protein LptE/RlpB
VKRSLALAALVLLCAACGYSVRGQLPSHIKTVAVPIFVNKTAEPAVEGLVTRAIVEAFSTNGKLKVVRREDADAILEGEVVAYTVDSIAFDPTANVRQYRLTITLNLRFKDVRKNEMLFEQVNFQERADFQ